MVSVSTPSTLAAGEFAAWMRRCRIAAMLTQEELASRATVCVRTVRNLEAGRGGRPQTMRLVAAALRDVQPQPATARPVPAQLVSDVHVFRGRDAELRTLDRWLATARPGATATGVAVLSGPDGVGKTALAVHWSHRARAAFPDGQLYVDFQDSRPGGTPDPAQVLAGFLRALGVPAAELPVGLHERAAWFRTLVAGRRLLILLDDVGAAEQIWPVLPGTATCSVLVTCRGGMEELTTRFGARQLRLGPLPLPDAVGLLRALGLDRRGGGWGAAALAGLAERCERLPSALRTAAASALA